MGLSRPRFTIRRLMIAVAVAGGRELAIGSRMVYVTATETKYHHAGCRYLARSSRAMTLAEASTTRPRCSKCGALHPTA